MPVIDQNELDDSESDWVVSNQNRTRFCKEENTLGANYVKRLFSAARNKTLNKKSHTDLQVALVYMVTHRVFI